MSREFPVTEQYLPVKDSKIYYETSGTGKPIIFIHAGFMNCRMWEEQVSYFSAQREVIVLDMRGYGLTIDGKEDYNMCDGIKLLMDTLHISKADIVGMSIGAVIATDFALQYRQYVNRLVLVSPGLKDWKEMLPEDSLLVKNDAQMKEAYFKTGDTALAAEYFIRSWYDGPQRDAFLTASPARTLALSMAEEKIKRGFAYNPVFDTVPVLGRLPALRLPVLVITGEKDNAIIKVIASEIKDQLLYPTGIVVPGVAHLINLEKPWVFNHTLEKFLQQ